MGRTSHLNLCELEPIRFLGWAVWVWHNFCWLQDFEIRFFELLRDLDSFITET